MDTLIYTPTLERLSQLTNGTNSASVLHIYSNLALALPCFRDGIFEKVILELSEVSELSQPTLHSLYTIMKANGLLTVHFTTSLNGSDATLKDIYTIAGFKEESAVSTETLVLRKPSFAGKGAVSLKKKNANGALNENSNNKAVKLNGDDDIQFNNAPKAEKMDLEKSEPKKNNPFAKFSVQASNDELINEDNLLDNEEGYKRLGTDDSSCATKPKACANCSCGRAELEAQAEVTGADLSKNIETGKVESSCGNCYLGDAFRCASCPYKGLPAFKPGDKVQLDLSKDSLGGVLNESNNVVVSNGKVKLQI